MSGRKCLLKLHLHSRKELLEIESGVAPLQEEIEILKILNAVQKPCENIVRLLGSSIEAPIHMIIERTPKGDLWTYLHDLTNPPLVDELIRISQGVCEAMIFLGDNCIIHRDLCARSCFVFNKDPQGNMLVKLGDFHLAILSYSRLESCAVSSSVNEYPENEFAVRWSAVEALRDGEFSPASDVWSFGVLLFEIFTFGSRPYVNMPSGMSLHRDEEVRKYVLNGNKLELHPKIPDSIRKIIQSTMKKKDHRPTFRHLKSDFMDLTFHQEIYKEPAHYQKLHRSPSKIVLPKDLQVRRSNSGSE
ncbi:tyrosine-protein kinase CSK-like [Dendronephthya gigantea]|uniref:tyrosine-protein kinase CSK-like n=1 Tax=Dendronephthya gigantea TaxID=151771 RepID=UPI00106B7B14|nr:tyrosine-protein kinase CSK-like [Dendronephthya gigantea]